MELVKKAFISYSWTTPEHEEWVKKLAEELLSNGVDVMLDKWDLREGHDSISFMERMVTDPSISKVIMVCDEVYAKKANSRASGVGAETSIISPEIYSNQSQDKFVAVLPEKGTDGKAFLPIYYKSRIYIDLSVSDKYLEGFDRLLRWIFDKPLDVKPELGKPPSFIMDANSQVIGTSIAANRAIDAIKSDKPYLRGALDDYLKNFSNNIERFRLESNGAEDFDENIVKSIEEFTPARDEFLQVISILAQYSEPTIYAKNINRFFEGVTKYFYVPNGVNGYNECDFDNFKFSMHELYLCTLAIFLREENFPMASQMLSANLIVENFTSSRNDSITDYTVFYNHLKSLNYRNSRLNLSRISVHADMLKQRSIVSIIELKYLMQADFVCFLRNALNVEEGSYQYWWPITLIFSHRQFSPFEIFSRSISREYFQDVVKLLGCSDEKDFVEKYLRFKESRRFSLRFDYETVDVPTLIGRDKLATRA